MRLLHTPSCLRKKRDDSRINREELAAAVAACSMGSQELDDAAWRKDCQSSRLARSRHRKAVTYKIVVATHITEISHDLLETLEDHTAG
jgi:hypothetical protein